MVDGYGDCDQGVEQDRRFEQISEIVGGLYVLQLCRHRQRGGGRLRVHPLLAHLLCANKEHTQRDAEGQQYERKGSGYEQEGCGQGSGQSLRKCG